MNLNIIYNFCRQKKYFIITSDLKNKKVIYTFIFFLRKNLLSLVL